MKVILTKLAERENAEHPNNIETGSSRIYIVAPEEFKPPTVGECFYLSGITRFFRTSTVQEIIDDRTFKTVNSIYRWTAIEEETTIDNFLKDERL